MANQFSQVRWGRVIGTALIVYGASFLITFLIITVYAFTLAFQARGAPDQALIQTFASQHASQFGTISLIPLTFLGALWLANVVKTATRLHGLLLGLIVSLAGIILFQNIGSLGLRVLITTTLIAASGWLGGVLIARRGKS